MCTSRTFSGTQVVNKKRLELCRGYTKFDFTVDEGKGRLNPSRDKKVRQAPQKEGGERLLCGLLPV